MGDKKQQKMIPGTYMLRIYVEETKELTMKKPGELNALMVCNVFGQSHKSKVHENASLVQNHWRQNYFFMKKIEDESEVEDEIIEIVIKDSELLGDDPLIGRLEIDLMSIYRQNDEHSIKYQWAGLSNDDEDFNSAKGYIKFSANLFTHGQTPADLGDEPVAPGKPGGSDQKILMPPQLKHTPYQLNALIVKGEKMPKQDAIGNLDCYVMVEYASQHVKTEKVKDSQNPKFQQQVMLPFSQPCLTAMLKFNFFDWDEFEEDFHFGTTMIHKDGIYHLIRFQKVQQINMDECLWCLA